MKSIKSFSLFELKSYNKVYGGDFYYTSYSDDICDTWHDVDGDGKPSAGDTICYHRCF